MFLVWQRAGGSHEADRLWSIHLTEQTATREKERQNKEYGNANNSGPFSYFVEEWKVVPPQVWADETPVVSKP